MTTNEELRARAEALPRERWHVGTGHYAREVRQGPAPVLGGSPSIAWVGESDEALAQAHAAYIAAASPDVILRLLDENARLRAVNGALHDNMLRVLNLLSTLAERLAG
jgi:hypothetical protein